MQKGRNEPATATIEEVAVTFGIARSTAYELAKNDALPIPVIRLGRRMVVSRDLLTRVLAGESVRPSLTNNAAPTASDANLPASRMA